MRVMRNFKQLRKRSSVFLAFVIAICSIILSPQRAARAAGVVGNGTPASCTSNALQAAIEGGGLVTFDCGANPHTIVTDTYVITQTVTIDGAGLITFDGDDSRQHFYVLSNGELTVKNLKLSKGNQTQGGSILNVGKTNIDNVIFQNNSALEDGGAIWSSGTLSITRATFDQNKTTTNTLAIGYGGAIASLGVMTMTDSAMMGNQGRFGGSVFVGGAIGTPQAVIDRVLFIDNIASQNGGGLYANSDISGTTILTITRSLFESNDASFGGGLARFNARMFLSDSAFVENRSLNSGGGGGLFVSAGPTPDVGGYVQVRSTTFSGNSADGDKGGGIYNNGFVELYHTTIVSNTNGVYTFGTNEITRLRSSVLQNPGSLNCDGDGTTPINDGYNHSTDNSCGTGIPSKPDPMLAELKADSAVSPSYHLPLTGSPLINQGPSNCPLRDQRNLLRPDACDIGAVEFGGYAARLMLPIVIRN
jgi:predicted outer membrane repeat protein